MMTKTGRYDDDIEFTAPRVADWVPPVKEGCREYSGGDYGEVGGGGVCVCVDRGWDGQPSAIPDEMCVWDGEGKNSIARMRHSFL
jgi:hypothetical protein